MNKYPLIGGSICAVVLLVLASLTNVVGFQTAQLSKPKTVTFEINNNISNEPWEKTIYRLCHIQSGEVRHSRYDGWFIGTPMEHPEFGFCHYGIGSFVLTLQRDYFTGENETTLVITNELLNNVYNDNNITLRVSLFIGFYQPTGDLGAGALSGYALRVKILDKS